MQRNSINTKKYAFSTDTINHIKVILSGYSNPTIKHQINIQQEIKETLITLLAAFSVAGLLSYLTNNLIFFPTTIDLNNLIDLPRLFILTLLTNTIFGLMFSTTTSTFIYLCYKIKVKKLIKTVSAPCVFYTTKLYALTFVACSLIGDIYYENFLCYGTLKIEPHSDLGWIILLLSSLLIFFSFWWFFINPIYKLIQSQNFVTRKLCIPIHDFHNKLTKFITILINRITIPGIFTLITMLTIAPWLAVKLIPNWGILNQHEFKTELKNSPFYHKKMYCKFSIKQQEI